MADYTSKHTGTEIDALVEQCGRVMESLKDLNETTATVNEHDAYISSHKDEVKNILVELADKASLTKGNVFSCQLKKIVDCKIKEAPTKSLIKINDSARVPGTYAPVFSCAVKDGDIVAGVQPYSEGSKNGYQFSWYHVKNDQSHSQLARITDKGQVFGAVWNDFAEFRNSNETCAGRVVCECGDGFMIRSNKRLQPGASIVSDTFGFAIGETKNEKTPIAIAGRVLAYPNEKRNSYKPGDPVCAGPNGTVSKMSRREVRKYPDRIIGTVSEIPDYEIWGDNEISVNGRIWIRIK